MKYFNIKIQVVLALSIFILFLFILLGLLLVIFFIQNITKGFSGISLMQFLFFAVGLYLIYKPAMYIKFLIVKRKRIDTIFNGFINENKIAIVVTVAVSSILLYLFYSNLHHNFDFFVNAFIYLPVFLFSSLVFIAKIFIVRHKLGFLSSLLDLILPISQIIYVLIISKFIAKLLNKTKK